MQPSILEHRERLATITETNNNNNHNNNHNNKFKKSNSQEFQSNIDEKFKFTQIDHENFINLMKSNYDHKSHLDQFNPSHTIDNENNITIIDNNNNNIEKEIHQLYENQYTTNTNITTTTTNNNNNNNEYHDNDDSDDENEDENNEKQKQSKKFIFIKQYRQKCYRQCKMCLKQIRMPKYLSKSLFWLYTHTGSVITYGLFLCAIYTTILSIKPNIALLPHCRKFYIPKFNSIINEDDSTNNLSQQFNIGLECEHGEALSILIFYGIGFAFGEIMELLHLPGLLGMLLGGLFLRNLGATLTSEQIYHYGKLPNGSYPVGYISTTDAIPTVFPAKEFPFNITDTRSRISALFLVNPALSGTLRQLALTTILTRAGLGLDPGTLKQVCGSVFRLAFIPCICEALALMLVSRFLIGWPWAWGAILGFVCAAVSPAVIVPNMMRLEVTGWGVAEGIPTLVVAASSLDDVVAITGFGVALSVALSTGSNLVATLFWGPFEALLGALFGASVGSLLLIFPPPKLEHSHLMRGILLICLAITGLVGSVLLHVPGAGALACLTLAFVVASGWRQGFPWRLTQPLTTDIKETSSTNSTEVIVDKLNLSKKSLSDNQYPISTIHHDNILNIEEGSSKHSNQMKFENLQNKENQLSNEMNKQQTYHNKTSTTGNILESLVEFHPYYCSILRQQYGQISSSEQSNRSSVKSRFNLNLKNPVTGDLPALAVAVAATGTEKKDYPTITSTNIINNSIPKSSRRFSLPEPTAHYELESFSVSNSFRRGRSPSTTTPGLRHINRSRRRILFPTFAEQYASMYNNQLVDKVEEVEEDDTEQLNQINKLTTIEQNNNINFNKNKTVTRQESISSEQIPIDLPATPIERGLACLNSMRLTLAATWWFVQPILFSLIGSEVLFLNMRGGSTGRGIGAFLISLVVRLGATILAVLPSKLNMRERLFVAFAWLPKATVQAAVGPVALDTARQLNAGPQIIEWGEQVLTLAAISILITAPIGAILMPLTAPYLLHQDIQASQVLVERTQTKSTSSQIKSNTNKSCEETNIINDNNNNNNNTNRKINLNTLH